MKKYFNPFLFMLVGVALFTACKEDDEITKGEWNAADGYANISFVESATTIEIDPADPTSYTLHMSRRNTAGAVTVPIQVISGDAEVFSASDAVFADGDSIAEFVINYPNAEVGTTYTVQFGVDDPKYTSYYSDAVYTTFTVTRVKWNSIGMGTYTDTWFGSQQKVEIFQNESQPNVYRISKPYSEYDGDDYFIMNGEVDDFLTLTIRKKGETFGGVTFTREDLVTFPDYYTGAVHPNYTDDVIVLVHPYRFTSLCSESNFSHNCVTAVKEDGTPGMIQLAPYFYMFKHGGWNNTQNDGIITINFPGYVARYEAQFPDDFEWSNVKTFDLTNTLNGESTNVMLQKATCKVNTDDCDSLFTETYGVPYLIKDAYAEGYDLLFFVKGKKIYIPSGEDFEGFELQPTGVTERLTGKDIYAFIESEGSSINYTEDGDINSVTLNVTFTDKDGSSVFGTGEQTLTNITWSKIATGTYYYVMFAENEEGNPEPDPGYSLYKRDDRDDTYKIADWLMGTDFMFQWNRETNECVVLDQDIAYNHPSYGAMYIIEGALYHPNYAEHTSYYDPKAKMFHFFPAYYVSAGSFGQVEEFFEITEEGAVKRQATLSWGNAKLNAALRKQMNSWKMKTQKLSQPITRKKQLNPVKLSIAD